MSIPKGDMRKGPDRVIHKWLIKKPTSPNKTYLSPIRLAMVKGLFHVESLRARAIGVKTGTHFSGGQREKISKTIHTLPLD